MNCESGQEDGNGSGSSAFPLPGSLLLQTPSSAWGFSPPHHKAGRALRTQESAFSGRRSEEMDEIEFPSHFYPLRDYSCTPDRVADSTPLEPIRIALGDWLS